MVPCASLRLPLTSTLSLMNEALEFHDSKVASVVRESGVMRMSLEPAYVHRSSGRPGIDAGKGYVQSAEIAFSDARVEQEGACIGSLSSGSISCDDQVFDNVLPMPFSVAGAVQAKFEFASGGVLQVWALACACWSKGEARYVEAYEG